MFTVLKDEKDVIKNLQSLIEKIAKESITARGEFFIGFSGKKCEFAQNLLIIGIVMLFDLQVDL